MNDLIERLERAGRRDHSDADPASVDDDIRRAHRALARRRVQRSAAGTALAVAVAVGVVAGTRGSTPRPTVAAPSHPSSTTAAPAKLDPSIQLVSYGGAQLPGYTVGLVPSGWVLQGANAYDLVIARPDDPDKSLDSFAGKLVVMLASVDQSMPTSGTTVSVGGASGIVSHVDPSTAQLFFHDDAGHLVDIQAPATLGWSDTQLAQFGASVHVNASATAGRG